MDRQLVLPTDQQQSTAYKYKFQELSENAEGLLPAKQQKVKTGEGEWEKEREVEHTANSP